MKRILSLVMIAGVATGIGTKKAKAADPDQDLAQIRERYHQWVLESPTTDYSNPNVQARYGSIGRRARQVLKHWEEFDFSKEAPLYDTREAGDDLREVAFLVTDVLPNLSIAYRLKGPEVEPNPYFRDEYIRDKILLAFDRLHQRGFREGMLMPWKAQHVADEPVPSSKGVIVDFQLRIAGYGLAVFLMRDELAEHRILNRSLRTCRQILEEDDKFGSLLVPSLNADGMRIAVNFALPYSLAAEDHEQLAMLKKQLDRSMAKASDASGTIKPDGLGFHHRAVYLAGYAPYAVAQAAFAARLLDGTAYAPEPVTVANLTHSMEVLRLVSQKYDMHKALAGRLKPSGVLPSVIMGYGDLAAFDHPERPKVEAMLSRLADDAFLDSPLAGKSFSSQRNEVPPGPGGIDAFFRVLDSARQRGAEPDPNGHWAFNYGPLSVHRRVDWMVSVKGFSKYLWAFERSHVDARMEARLENIFGFHDSSAHIRIHSGGDPVNAGDSGYAPEGWDWCRIPGATTRLIPEVDFLEMDRDSEERPLQRPFSRSTFTGGLSFDRKHGLFAMQYQEPTPDRRKPALRAMKGLFFFGDHIIVMTRAINEGDGKYPVATTLFQTALPEADSPTWVQNKKVTGLKSSQRFEGRKRVTLVDAVGNGYVIPRAGNLVVRRSKQSHLGEDGVTEGTGNFATAWFDHGKSPEHVACDFVILPAAGKEKTAAFAKEKTETYSVIQGNSRGIIVESLPFALTGYILPVPDVEIERGMIAQVSAPCLAMIESRGGREIGISVCNPDLGWEPGEQYEFRKQDRDALAPPMKPVSMPVTLTLRGRWELKNADDKVTIDETGEETTRLTVATGDGRNIEFQLRKAL